MQSTSGTKLDAEQVAVTEFKWQLSRENKAKVKAEKGGAKLQKIAQEKADEEAEMAARVSKQKLFRCGECSKPFKRKWHMGLHQTIVGRCQERVSKKQKMIDGAASVTFATMHGAKVGAISDSLVDQSKLLGKRVKLRFTDSSQLQHSAQQGQNQIAVCQTTVVAFSESHNQEASFSNRYKHNLGSKVEFSIASLVFEMVDFLVFTSGADNIVPQQGWATKECNMRPSNPHPKHVTDLMRGWFDHKVRHDQFLMAEKLEALFPYGAEALKPAQIQGWISSEKDRRKKAAILQLSESAVALEESELLISHEVEEAYRKFWKEEPRSKIDGWKVGWRSRRGAAWAEGAKEEQAKCDAGEQAKCDATSILKDAKRQRKLEARRRGGAARQNDEQQERQTNNKTTKKTTGAINKNATTKTIVKAPKKTAAKATAKVTKKAVTKATKKAVTKATAPRSRFGRLQTKIELEDIQIRKETLQQTQPFIFVSVLLRWGCID